MTIPGVGESVCIGILEGICGDANGDGEVNVLDAVITFQHIVGLAPTNACSVTDTQSIGKVVITK